MKSTRNKQKSSTQQTGAMSKQSTVEVLTNLAQLRTEAAARELGTLNTLGKQLEEKLALLLRYRDDYQARFREAVKNGLAGAGWDNFHHFMDKLDAAINAQRLGLTQLRDRVTSGQTKWKEEQRKLDSYDVLAQRHAKDEARHIAKREQREHDEHAAKTQRARSGTGHRK